MPDIFVSKKKSREKKVEEDKVIQHKEHKPDSRKDLESGTVGFFTSFVENPSGVSFEEQDKDEKIVMFLRSHFIINLKSIIVLIFLGLLPPVFFVTNSLFPTIPLPFQFGLILSAFYYLSLIVIFYVIVVIWFFNVNLVTNKRIIDIDFSDLFYNNVAVTTVDMIEDLDYSQGGFFRSYFNYGDVFAQTAAEKVNFDFLAIPKPKRVVAVINDLMEKNKKNE